MSAIRFKPVPIDIPDTNPFEKDALDRKKSAEVLTDFVGSLSEPFVLAIDSPWGTGKTTFLRMWLQHLKTQGFRCLFFNAWENDFTDSPLVSLIGEIGTGIEALKLGENHKEKAQQRFEKAKNAGAAILKAALPTAVKLATSGLLDLSAATEADLSKLAEDVAKKQIEKYQADKNTISGFRNALIALVKELATNESSEVAKPVVFIIDELDRCRPTYAVELLEKIKHLFSVDGLIFVLAIDREQLGESVRALYGTGLNADGYLRRFIDLEYRLPEPDHEKFAEAQFERFGLNTLLDTKVGHTRNDGEQIRQVLPKLFSVFGFSLRTQEQCFTQLSVVLRTTPPNCYLYGVLLAALICLRSARRQLYMDYCSGRALPDGVLTYLRSLPGGASFIESRAGAFLEACLVKGIRNESQREKVMANYFAMVKDTATNDEANRRAKAVSELFAYAGLSTTDMSGYLFNKIEMAHRFVRPEKEL